MIDHSWLCLVMHTPRVIPYVSGVSVLYTCTQICMCTISTQKQPGYKIKCGPVQSGQCEKVVKSKGAAKKLL